MINVGIYRDSKIREIYNDKYDIKQYFVNTAKSILYNRGYDVKLLKNPIINIIENNNIIQANILFNINSIDDIVSSDNLIYANVYTDKEQEEQYRPQPFLAEPPHDWSVNTTDFPKVDQRSRFLNYPPFGYNTSPTYITQSPASFMAMPAGEMMNTIREGNFTYNSDDNFLCGEVYWDKGDFPANVTEEGIKSTIAAWMYQKFYKLRSLVPSDFIEIDTEERKISYEIEDAFMSPVKAYKIDISLYRNKLGSEIIKNAKYNITNRFLDILFKNKKAKFNLEMSKDELFNLADKDKNINRSVFNDGFTNKYSWFILDNIIRIDII